MLRHTLLYLSEQSWLRHWMENSSLSRNLTSRFIAGQDLAEGIRVIQNLSKERILATLDFLGENVHSLDDAGYSRQSYVSALCEIAAAGLPATVSIKLTQFGLDLSEAACRSNVFALAEMAKAIGSRVEVDMESSAYTDRTLQIVTELQERFAGHVRAVIQAYLYRSEADIRKLSELRVPVRLCKGAYREPAAVAFPRKAEVDANYLKLMKLLLSEGEYPAIASHDEGILRAALRYVAEQGIAPERFEFQMLYGIRRDLQRELVSKNFRLRLYVPYGDAWYPYFMRRLAERPANLLFLAKNLVRS
ncbi:MAG: proline dehydrogenase family protein [Acidobacteriaceae bacterium]|nr:proline dehydrogenase family protein [Acidobacteriaceae bacterium]MBV8570742.1 proline dehydrogenase family protein [Acidobacteriaceae bacterium]